MGEGRGRGTAGWEASYEAEMYMNLLWTLMVKEHCYQEWFSHKQSAKYSTR
jgi:hypothetical protein